VGEEQRADGGPEKCIATIGFHGFLVFMGVL
jgi:hypothetical protein